VTVSAPAPLLDERRDAYLERIGVESSLGFDRAALGVLQRAHLLTVPFENLDIHLGHRIELDLDAIVSKVVDRRRGGFCYELNSAFAALLVSLGFEVDLIEGRVYGEGKVGIRFDHLALVVTIGSSRYLADVGFGALSDEPLSLDSREEQIDSAGRFRITDRDDGWLDLFSGSKLCYRFSVAPRELADFAAGCTYNQTSPDSHFTRNTVCTLPTARGRVTLAGSVLTHTQDGVKTTQELDSGQLGPALADRFGIVLGDADLAKLRAL
jgi:N-hydroxyarylamine O-acetyltransferase